MNANVEAKSKQRTAVDFAAHVAARHARLMASDAQYRAAQPDESTSAAKKDFTLRFAPLMAHFMAAYADRPALGRRVRQLATDPATGRRSLVLRDEFETITYRDLWARVRALANAWHHDDEARVRSGEFVAILGFGGIGFVVPDLAAYYLGAVGVPLQTNAPLSQLTSLLAETAPRCLAVSIEELDTAVGMILGGHRPASLLVFEYCPEVDEQRAVYESACQRLTAAGVATRVESLENACERGRDLPAAPPFVAPAGTDPLATIYYTSGSTGLPKGVMYGEGNAASSWRAPKETPMIALNYMPLNHSFGRSLIGQTLSSGGTCYFTAKSDMSSLFDDIAKLRPTHINLVPRLCDMIFQRYQAELDARGVNAKAGANADRDALLEDFRVRVLGGRIQSANFGSAPLARELRDFIERCIDLPFVDSYGTTEIIAFCANTRVLKPPIIDYKLVDVPELGYFGTDKPHPRGELLVKTRSIMQGYYKRPKETAEAFDSDGYYRTGDVMAIIGPDQLIYVDRRNNVQKLAQGEFVAIATLEAAFVAGDPVIQQIYLYGSSDRAYLLAVIVPNRALIEQAGVAVTDEAGVKALLRAALQKVAVAKEMQSYEVPRDFIVEWEPFTTENGLLAGIGKYRRPAFKEHYGARLEAMYTEIAAGQSDELRELRSTGRDAPVPQTIARAVQATLGISGVSCDAQTKFADLGGDSLSALSLSMLLEEIYGVEVPVGTITDPAGTLGKLARFVERARGKGAAARPTFASIHGREATVAQARDLSLDKFIDADTLARAAKLAPASVAMPRTVLVTGANGYLGRFLCLDWLEKMHELGGRVICVIRGRDAAEARLRLFDAMQSGDATLTEHFRVLARDHLEVLAGDLAEEKLGLDDGTWKRLTETVDVIVHPAALVNHVLPYSQLFGPNVVGTAELIRLAITARMKRFVNVSTIAAVMGEGHAPLDEMVDVRQGMPSRLLANPGYASGYAASKWAAEVLLHDAHQRFALPMLNFRSDMILAHSRYGGQLNVPDMFTRWIFSIVRTGLAPRSFYLAPQNANTRPHYDGLPVDFTAAAITSIALAQPTGLKSFHVLNPHDDGISMDTFVDWIVESGVPIQRIDDYSDWLRRFATALRALPEKERQQSFLPLLHQMRERQPAIAGSLVPATQFRRAVQTHAAASYRDIPQVSRELIRKYLTDLRLVGLLGAGK